MNKNPDYKSLIDEEIWDFIDRTNQWYPADAVERSIEEQRAIYTTMCREFYNGHPVGVQVIDDTICIAEQRIPVRRYEHGNGAVAAHIVYLHGGGFVVGDLDSHDDVCAELCAQSGLSVTAVDYRLCPEHKHPAAFDDCVTAVRSEAERVNIPILLCGDSAGGNLCAAVSHHSRTAMAKSPIAGQVLIYPLLGSDTGAGSYVQHAHAPMLTRDDLVFYNRIRVDGSVPIDDVRFSPLHDTDFSNLPPTLVLSAECDPLADEGRIYCDAINNAGGQAIWRLEAGLVHGYLRARHSSSRAQLSFQAITTALRKFAGASIVSTRSGNI